MRRRTDHRSPQQRGARVQREILALADRVGIGAGYRQIPDSAKARMYDRPCLPPAVTLDRTVSNDPAAGEAADRIRDGLRQTELVLTQFGDARVPLWSVYSALAHLDWFLRDFSKEHPTHEAALRCARTVEEVVRQVGPVASSSLEMLSISSLMPHQRFDVRLYGVRLPRPVKGARQIRMEMQLFSEPARRVNVALEGATRPAYQCGGFLRPGTIEWVVWKPADVGVEGPDQPFPVLVQSHAIDQLFERLCLPPEVPQAIVMFFQSLAKPNVVVRNPDGSLLVECAGPSGRLGYFVVRFLGDAFLVNTFLFLTMSGTPEASRIYDRLHVGRHAVEMMKLDDLMTFVLSDVRRDRKLVSLLTECGCGHLFALSESLPFRIPALLRQSRNLRRILGWAAETDEEAARAVEAAGPPRG